MHLIGVIDHILTKEFKYEEGEAQAMTDIDRILAEAFKAVFKTYEWSDQ